MPKLCLWLIPESAEEARLQELIDDLARSHGCRPFAAHATLISGIVCDEATATTRAESFAKHALQQQAIITGLGMEDFFYRFLYYELACDSALAELNAAAYRDFNVNPRDFRPHVSLVYADPLTLQAGVIAKGVKATREGDPLLFDRLALMDVSHRHHDQWHRIAVFPLRK